MEKEIKVRKKRFAAFWVAVLLAVVLVLPAAALENGVLSEADTMLKGGTRIRAEEIKYYDSDGSYLNTYNQEESGGWQAIRGYTDFSNVNPTNGYEFDVWEVTANSGNTKEYDSVQYPASVSLKARLKPITYTIDCDLAGGTGTMVTEYTVETETFTLTEPTKTGCTFAGWTNATLTEPTKTVTVKKGTTGLLSFTANWDKNTYNVEYVLNGGTNAESNPSQYTYGSGISGFADASKAGYTFAGWYSDSSFTTKVESISTTDTKNYTLYAKFVYDSGTIRAGTYYLKKNTPYQLDGVTKVNSDISTYVDGSTFYVPADGKYTFS